MRVLLLLVVLSGCYRSHGLGASDAGPVDAEATDVVRLDTSVFPDDPPTSVAAGNTRTYAVHRSGRVSAWGGRDDAWEPISTPYMVPLFEGVHQVGFYSNHACAALGSAGAVCWGNNETSQLGDGTVEGTRETPVQVMNLTNVESVCTGYSHSCGLHTDGSVSCWGSPYLGNGTSGTGPPTAVAGITAATQISCGGGFSCALLTTGRVRCWGYNGDEVTGGRLADGSTTVALTPVDAMLEDVVAISSRWQHSCAITTPGDVYCWGDNRGFGLGTRVDSPTRVPVQAEVRGARSISAGSSHTCAVLEDGQVSCWGDNLYGALGRPPSEPSGPQIVPGITNAVMVSAGTAHTCALTADSRIVCWGQNLAGELGVGDSEARDYPGDAVRL